jgi:hypothetical protein
MRAEPLPHPSEYLAAPNLDGSRYVCAGAVSPLTPVNMFLGCRPPVPLHNPEMINHDRLFKELLTEFFTDFVDLLLPDLTVYLDKNSLVFLDKELFTDLTSGESREADLVVRARFCGLDSFFLVHLEHQARSEPEFGRRMFRYFARLHEKHALPVYPIGVPSAARHPPIEPCPDAVDFRVY